MIISQHTTFHARLAVKGPNIYLSFQSQRPLLLYTVVVCNESIYVAGISQGEQTAKYQTALIYIRLSLGPRIRLSNKAAAARFATSRKTMCGSALNQPPEKQLGGRGGSKARLLTSPVLALSLSYVLCSLLFSFSLFTGKCTANKRLS